jgi:hypothetical protein
MRHPIEITQHHDIENPPVYVRYSNERVASTKSVDPDFAVNVDLDAAGLVVGIELIAVDPYTIEWATQVARAHDLAIPDAWQAAVA